MNKNNTIEAEAIFGNPNPSATVGAWPMQHPLAASLVWSIVILLLGVVVAERLYRRRTSD